SYYSLSYDKSVDILSLTTYISKLKNLPNELNALDIVIDDNMIVSKILLSLSLSLSLLVKSTRDGVRTSGQVTERDKREGVKAESKVEK
ncbi:hypothetical protein ALC62_10490, partial [Cyphomyrmex costatus]